MPNNNDEIRIRLTGKKDRQDHDYYVGFVQIPASVNLDNAVVLVFPDEESDGRFGADLVIKHRDEEGRRRMVVGGLKPRKKLPTV